MALNPTTMLEIGTMVTSIGQSSHVWTTEGLEKKILVEVPSSKVITAVFIHLYNMTFSGPYAGGCGSVNAPP